MTRLVRLLSPALIGLVLFAAGDAAAQTRGKFKRLDVPFAVTPPAGIDKMLRLAGVGPDDVVYDLGSGDGRIVIAAVKDFGAREGVGVDIDHNRVVEAMANARKAGVANRTRFYQGDVFRFDFSEATVVTTFMSTRINTELLPTMKQQLKPGTRVVTYRFLIVGRQPDRVIRHDGDEIYLYTITDADKKTSVD